MFKNECDLDEAKVNWILKCTDNLKRDLSWKGLNLRPALIRYLNLALFSVGRQWLEKRLSSQMHFKDILIDLEHHEKTPCQSVLSSHASSVST